MPDKIGNLLNPFAVCDAESLVRRLRRIIENAPPFGSPENIAQLEAAERDGERFATLMMLPTDTLPH